MLNINSLKSSADSNHLTEELAEAFNAHFSSIADKLRSHLHNVQFHITKLKHFVLSKKDPDVTFKIPPISKGFVVDSLSSLSANKAIGVDKISSNMLKDAAPFIVSSVSKMINISLLTSVFPQRWKTAKVTPLHKNGDRSDVNNYRPISVLPVVSKIVERHVHDSLCKYLCDNNLLYYRQSGFYKHHSTEIALVRIVDELLFNLDKNKVSGMIMIDYSKAFDMIDHRILLAKLEAYGVTDTSLMKRGHGMSSGLLGIVAISMNGWKA